MKKKDKSLEKDVTGNISDNNEIQKAQEELNCLFNLVPELICIASVDGYFKKLNPAWENILGFSIKELMSKPFKEFIHPDDIEPTFAEVEKQLKGSQTINFTNRYLCKNGEYKLLNWVATPSPDKILLYAAARDITDNIRREEELSASEEKYRAFFENSMDAILLTSPDGGICEANQAACEMLGYTESEIIGLGRAGIMDTTETQLPILLKERTLIGKARGELTLIKKGDIKFQSEVSSAFFTDKDGDTRTVMIIRDVTERKQAEDALRESEELLHTVLNNAPITIFATDSHGVFTLSEGKLLESVDLKPGKNVGFSAFDLFCTLPFFENTGKETTGNDIVRRVLKGETIIALSELRGICFENHLVPIHNADGKVVGMIGVAIDITERKQTEEALRDSESKYRTLFESSLTGISTTNLDGHLIQANRAFTQIYGFDSPEQMLNEVTDVSHLYTQPEKRKELLRTIREKGEIGPKEFEVVKRDGSPFYILLSSHEVKDYSGNFLYFQAEHIDISEQKKLEEELKQSRKEMLELSLHIEESREKERAKIAMDLHDDLGQKLTALIMDLAWMKRKLPFEIPDILDKMSSMSALLNETLIDIQNIAGGLRPSILDDLGLAAAIKWIIQKFSENSGLNFRFTISPEELTLSSELSIMIFRIIQETFTNIVRHASATQVKLTLIKKRSLLTIVIKDNGIGITPLQISSPVSFGLIGIRERIKTYEGTYSIKGEQGIGTEILIKIPLSNIT